MDIVGITWARGFIRWSEVPTSKMRELDSPGLYGVLIAKYDPVAKTWSGYKLLYIGQSFDQPLRIRIPQPHEAYACVQASLKNNPSYEVVVMIGIITSSSTQSITQSLMNDVECCLINSNQPPCNAQCKDTYVGRDLQVTNAGDFAPLRKDSICKPTTQ